VKRAVACALAALLWPGPARAIDPFEIQVYDPSVNEPRHLGVELHSIFTVGGSYAATPPELASHHVLHETLEPSFGLTRYWEVGAYLQTALRPDGKFDYAGVKLRTKVRLPVRESFPLQFAVNLEVSWVPRAYDAVEWGSELRPVVEWRRGGLTVDVNPILSFDWTGAFAGVPRFEPAAAVRYELFHLVAFGVEYYGALGPLTKIAAPSAQLHYLFETVSLTCVRRFALQIGIGAGLTPASDPLVAKVVAGYEF
jgi:hypothetical protein